MARSLLCWARALTALCLGGMRACSGPAPGADDPEAQLWSPGVPESTWFCPGAQFSAPCVRVPVSCASLFSSSVSHKHCAVFTPFVQADRHSPGPASVLGLTRGELCPFYWERLLGLPSWRWVSQGGDLGPGAKGQTISSPCSLPQLITMSAWGSHSQEDIGTTKARGRKRR